MITVEIAGRGRVLLEHLVVDFNGTLARDGCITQGVTRSLSELAGWVTIHILTADTHGNVQKRAHDLPCHIHIISGDDEIQAKEEYVTRLGSKGVVAVGNGQNDTAMLQTAAIGIGLIGPEGLASPVIAAADIIVTSIDDALGLLVHPQRLVATLRC